MPSMVWVRSVLKNACGRGQPNSVALPLSSALITSFWRVGAELHERRLVGLLAIGFERVEPAPVEVLQVLVGAGEREIDVVEHARVERARLARRAGHQPLGEGRDGGGVVGIEERAVSGAGWMPVNGGLRRAAVLMVLCLCERCRDRPRHLRPRLPSPPRAKGMRGEPRQARACSSPPCVTGFFEIDPVLHANATPIYACAKDANALQFEECLICRALNSCRNSRPSSHELRAIWAAQCRQQGPDGEGEARARALRDGADAQGAFGELAVDRRPQEPAAVCRSRLRFRDQRGGARAGPQGQRPRSRRRLGALRPARRHREPRTLRSRRRRQQARLRRDQARRR